MKRIHVDFNTLTSAPVGIVKLGQIGTRNGDRLPPLTEGERVILWEEGLEAEAIVHFYAEALFWVATPDPATWRDLPLPPEFADDISPYS